jgi:hypothetical protein
MRGHDDHVGLSRAGLALELTHLVIVIEPAVRLALKGLPRIDVGVEAVRLIEPLPTTQPHADVVVVTPILVIRVDGNEPVLPGGALHREEELIADGKPLRGTELVIDGAVLVGQVRQHFRFGLQYINLRSQSEPTYPHIGFIGGSGGNTREHGAKSRTKAQGH